MIFAAGLLLGGLSTATALLVLDWLMGDPPVCAWICRTCGRLNKTKQCACGDVA